MKHTLLTVLLVTLAGWVAPSQAQQTRTQQHVLKLPPGEAAMCLARNAETFLPPFLDVQARDTGGGYEVIVRQAGYLVNVSQVEAGPNGTVAKISPNGAMWMFPSLPSWMVAGC